MLIKLLCGTYGAKEGDIIISKTSESAPFEVEEKRGRQLIAMGYAREIKSSGHLDEEDAASEDTADGGEETDRKEAADTSEGKDLEDCSIQELRKMAKEKGLPTSGNKAQLIERIVTADNDMEKPDRQEEDPGEEAPIFEPAEPEV